MLRKKLLTIAAGTAFAAGLGVPAAPAAEAAPCYNANVYIGDAVRYEPDPFIGIPIKLDAPACNYVTVRWKTVDGSAVAPGDYQATDGSVTFAPGETSKVAWVKLVNDAVPEGTEGFRVVATAIVGAGTGDPSGIGWIRDDD